MLGVVKDTGQNVFLCKKQGEIIEILNFIKNFKLGLKVKKKRIFGPWPNWIPNLISQRLKISLSCNRLLQ